MEKVHWSFRYTLVQAATFANILVAVMTIKDCPELMTDGLKSLLAEQVSSCHPIVKDEIQKLFLKGMVPMH
jgi:hypothetical protein